ncbi:MAG: hypothetical protein M3Z25_05040 [Actinomycetota bacterium]|nr:hypothetical protein [Actinomycetota bacterium]
MTITVKRAHYTAYELFARCDGLMRAFGKGLRGVPAPTDADDQALSVVLVARSIALFALAAVAEIRLVPAP